MERNKRVMQSVASVSFNGRRRLSAPSYRSKKIAIVLTYILGVGRTNIIVAGMSLVRVARYALSPGSIGKHRLVVASGSVVDFAWDGVNPNNAAIVNAANEGCLGGGGVDGAINTAGGPNLQRDRASLPVLKRSVSFGEVRCPTGSAVITGPGSYGRLKVPYVIHAVGPNYSLLSDPEEGDKMLASAYRESLERAKEVGLEAVAFSLLSSGIFRGARSKKEVLKIGLKAVVDFEGYDDLQEVHLCAFSPSDIDTLFDIAAEEGLEEEVMQDQDP